MNINVQYYIMYITPIYRSEDDILNIISLSQSSDDLNQSYSILDGTVSVHCSSSSGSSSSDAPSDSAMDSLSECGLSDEDSDGDSDKDSDGDSDKNADENIT